MRFYVWLKYPYTNVKKMVCPKNSFNVSLFKDLLGWGWGGETLVKKELGSNMGVLFENRGDKNPL